MVSEGGPDSAWSTFQADVDGPIVPLYAVLTKHGELRLLIQWHGLGEERWRTPEGELL
jgi:hypothetical protein